MGKDTVIVVRGVLDWAKITGTARPYTGNPKYDKGPSWSLDITPDKASRAIIKNAGISSKLREPRDGDNRKETFLSLRHLATRADGSKNKPLPVKDAAGVLWNKGLIGNGTIADVKIKVKDYGAGSDKGTYPQAVRILSLVPYESTDFAPLSEDDKFFASGGDGLPEPDSSGNSGNIDDLDDDVPF